MSALRFAAALCAAFLPVASAQAGTSISRYHVTQLLDTLASAGRYSLDFQLTDGSLTGDGNSQVTLSNISLGGNLYDPGTEMTFGDVQGSLNTTLTFQDTSPGGIADFTQPFIAPFLPAVSPVPVSFDLTITHQSIDADQPDGFFLFLRDAGGNLLPTTGPAGIEFLDAEFTAAGDSVQGYGSPTDSSPQIAAPQIQAVPEASTAIWLPTGLAVLGLLYVRKRLKRKGTL